MDIRRIIREELEDIIHTDIHGKKSSPVDYTAVVIEGADSDQFESQAFQILKDLDIPIPKDWLSPNDYHMTITKGPLGLGQQMAGAIGAEVNMKIVSVGVSDDAIAFGVKGFYSRNENPHITFSFKKDPKDSNDIQNWIEITPFDTKGYIREIEKKDGWGRLKQIDESFGAKLISENQKPLPKQFDHLKWKFSNNQKYYLDDLCNVDPDSITESDVKNAAKFLGIEEKNVKSILNTYNAYDPMSEAVFEGDPKSPFRLGNKPVTVGDAMSAEEANRAPVRAKRTAFPMREKDFMTAAQAKTMSYAQNTDRLLNRSGNIEKSEKEKFYESTYTSLMMYLYCEINPKDIKLNHKNQVQIDQEPVLLEGESFSMENGTYRNINDLLKSFNSIFNTNFRISDHIDLSETSHKCHRTFVEHFGISDNKMFWCKDNKVWISKGQIGYEKLREEYIKNQGQQMSMPKINKVNHKDMLQKYFNGELIRYDGNADWLL